MFPEHAREVALIREARLRGDVGHRRIGGSELERGPLDAKAPHVGSERHATMGSERAREMRGVNPRFTRKLAHTPGVREPFSQDFLSGSQPARRPGAMGVGMGARRRGHEFSNQAVDRKGRDSVRSDDLLAQIPRDCVKSGVLQLGDSFENRLGGGQMFFRCAFRLDHENTSSLATGPCEVGFGGWHGHGRRRRQMVRTGLELLLDQSFEHDRHTRSLVEVRAELEAGYIVRVGQQEWPGFEFSTALRTVLRGLR